MKEYEVSFLQPERLEEVGPLLASLPEKSVILAGGTDLMIKLREERPKLEAWLSLCRLEELKQVELENGWLKIGAMVTHTQAAGQDVILRECRALAMACSTVGSQQIRNKGTVGGSIMNASVASDMIPCVCLYKGELEFLTPEGKKRISIFQYLEEKSRWKTPHTLLTAIYLPLEENRESCFLKLGRREEVTIAQISMCASWVRTQNGKAHMRLVVGGVNPIPLVYDGLSQFEGEHISEHEADEVAQMLREEIKTIRLNRTRPSRLKFTPEEQLYKERAVRGVVYDLVERINAL